MQIRKHNIRNKKKQYILLNIINLLVVKLSIADLFWFLTTNLNDNVIMNILSSELDKKYLVSILLSIYYFQLLLNSLQIE